MSSFADLSVGDRFDIGQTISFQLQDPYEQFLHFSPPIFLRSLNILLAARLRLNQDRIRNVTLTKENGLLIASSINIIFQSSFFLRFKGRSIVSFQLHEILTQPPTNEQVIHHLRHLINQQILNLLDPNHRVLNTVVGSIVVGRKKVAEKKRTHI